MLITWLWQRLIDIQTSIDQAIDRWWIRGHEFWPDVDILNIWHSPMISQFYLHTLRSSANGIKTIPAFAFPAEAGTRLIYRPRRDGRLSWPWVAGWLHTEINVRHRESNPRTVEWLKRTDISTIIPWYHHHHLFSIGCTAHGEKETYEWKNADAVVISLL